MLLTDEKTESLIRPDYYAYLQIFCIVVTELANSMSGS